MKSAIIGELEAIRRLKQSGFQPLRTIHMTIMPGILRYHVIKIFKIIKCLHHKIFFQIFHQMFR